MWGFCKACCAFSDHVGLVLNNPMIYGFVTSPPHMKPGQGKFCQNKLIHADSPRLFGSLPDTERVSCMGIHFSRIKRHFHKFAMLSSDLSSIFSKTPKLAAFSFSSSLHSLIVTERIPQLHICWFAGCDGSVSATGGGWIKNDEFWRGNWKSLEIGISVFPKAQLRETLKFEGSKINCFSRDQSSSALLYTL